MPVVFAYELKSLSGILNRNFLKECLSELLSKSCKDIRKNAVLKGRFLFA
jgi:hypothetical protein